MKCEHNVEQENEINKIKQEKIELMKNLDVDKYQQLKRTVGYCLSYIARRAYKQFSIDIWNRMDEFFENIVDYYIEILFYDQFRIKVESYCQKNNVDITELTNKKKEMILNAPLEAENVIKLLNRDHVIIGKQIKYDVLLFPELSSIETNNQNMLKIKDKKDLKEMYLKNKEIYTEIPDKQSKKTNYVKVKKHYMFQNDNYQSLANLDKKYPRKISESENKQLTNLEIHNILCFPTQELRNNMAEVALDLKKENQTSIINQLNDFRILGLNGIITELDYMMKNIFDKTDDYNLEKAFTLLSKSEKFKVKLTNNTNHRLISLLQHNKFYESIYHPFKELKEGDSSFFEDIIKIEANLIDILYKKHLNRFKNINENISINSSKLNKYALLSILDKYLLNYEVDDIDKKYAEKIFKRIKIYEEENMSYIIEGKSDYKEIGDIAHIDEILTYIENPKMSSLKSIYKYYVIERYSNDEKIEGIICTVYIILKYCKSLYKAYAKKTVDLWNCGLAIDVIEEFLSNSKFPYTSQIDDIRDYLDIILKYSLAKAVVDEKIQVDNQDIYNNLYTVIFPELAGKLVKLYSEKKINIAELKMIADYFSKFNMNQISFQKNVLTNWIGYYELDSNLNQ